MQYDHKKIEKKWQEEWAKNKIYTVPDQVPGKENFYLLVEFPYPSGNLHVGHWYAFSVPDILARFMRMQGKNVLYPIGFDAFGLPAENAAIKNNLNPREWTEKNIAYMSNQIRSMGTMFDWSREVQTIDPAYYKWTQWQFLQFYKKGLAYQKETAVNWCPKDKTVLANEQVIDGTCERCGTEVVQKMMLQWNLKITDYADRLHDDLEHMDWPKPIKDAQRAWIGRSEGAEIDFYLDFGDETINARTGPDGKKAHLTVFTTRADTLFGATYLVLAPEHPWVTLALEHKTVLENNEEVATYVAAANKKTERERQTGEREKTGVKLEGVSAINPATGEKIPLYVADYVLATYGTGAIMAVPSHDERDGEFAAKFDIPTREVIEPLAIRTTGTDAYHMDEEPVERNQVMAVVKHWEEEKYLCLKWHWNGIYGFVTGGVEAGEDPAQTALREIEEETGYSGAEYVKPLGSRVHAKFYAGNKKVNRFGHFTPLLFKLKDDTHVPVSETESSIHAVEWFTASEIFEQLGRNEFKIVWDRVIGAGVYTGDGLLVNSGEFDGLATEEANKLITKKYGRAKKTYRLRDWIVSRQRYWGVPIPVVHCPKCGIVAVPDEQLPVILPETDDYLPEGEGKSPLAKVSVWKDIRCPSCGGTAERETDTFDTFIDSSWYFLRYADPKNESEFASREKMDQWMPIDLYSGGAEHTTMHVLYSRFWQKALYDLGLVADAEPYTRRMNRGIILGPDGQKMSKSKGNVIDPDAVVARLGADTVRMYLAFIGPFNEVAAYPWNPDGVVGVRRFLERVWRMQSNIKERETSRPGAIFHKAMKKVGEDIPALKFNTAISHMMILLNAMEKALWITPAEWSVFLRLLAPFAPHMSEELWQLAGNATSVHLEAWPTYDEKELVEQITTYAIQIDGKTRGQVVVASDAGNIAIENAAREAVAARLEGKEIIRVIVVPGKLVNFVLKGE